MIQIMVIVDRVMASYLSEGDVSILHYGMRLNEMVFQGFVLTLVIPLYPLLSQVTVNGDLISLVKQVGRGIRKIFYVTVPLSVILMLGSRDLIEILYKSKHFVENEVILTANILSTYAMGLVFMGVNAIFFRAFIALGKLQVLMTVGILQAILKIVLNVVFLSRFGLVGLPLSSVVVTLFWTGTIALLFLRWSRVNLSLVSVLRYCLLVLLGIVLYYIVWLLNTMVNYPNLWLHGVGIIVLVIIGFYGIVLLIDKKSFLDVLKQ
jgi:putative peptidoglycan lipid II flippase